MTSPDDEALIRRSAELRSRSAQARATSSGLIADSKRLAIYAQVLLGIAGCLCAPPPRGRSPRRFVASVGAASISPSPSSPQVGRRP